MSDITEESLAILDLLRPTPEIFILGCGARIERPPEKLRNYMRSRNILLETVDTVNACQTFNVLNQEARLVVCGMIALGQPMS